MDSRLGRSNVQGEFISYWPISILSTVRLKNKEGISVNLREEGEAVLQGFSSKHNRLVKKPEVQTINTSEARIERLKEFEKRGLT